MPSATSSLRCYLAALLTFVHDVRQRTLGPDLDHPRNYARNHVHWPSLPLYRRRWATPSTPLGRHRHCGSVSLSKYEVERQPHRQKASETWRRRKNLITFFESLFDVRHDSDPGVCWWGWWPCRCG